VVQVILLQQFSYIQQNTLSLLAAVLVVINAVAVAALVDT
jgi:hypothetical protein